MGHAYDLLKVLTPPLGDTAADVRQWRWIMASCVYGLLVAFIIHLAWVGGGLGWAGIDGVASAGEVGDLSKAFHSSEQLRLETDIFNTRRRLCGAPVSGPLRVAYANELSKLTAQWRVLTLSDTGPELLSCADLGGNGE